MNPARPLCAYRQPRESLSRLLAKPDPTYESNSKQKARLAVAASTILMCPNEPYSPGLS